MKFNERERYLNVNLIINYERHKTVECDIIHHLSEIQTELLSKSNNSLVSTLFIRINFTRTEFHSSNLDNLLLLCLLFCFIYHKAMSKKSLNLLICGKVNLVGHEIYISCGKLNCVKLVLEVQTDVWHFLIIHRHWCFCLTH